MTAEAKAAVEESGEYQDRAFGVLDGRFEVPSNHASAPARLESEIWRLPRELHRKLEASSAA